MELSSWLLIQWMLFTTSRTLSKINMVAAQAEAMTTILTKTRGTV